ncbi:MAG: histidine phosphatase family protein [Dehalococcoidales bacterium]
MTEIRLIRHGETGWNAAELFRGRADIALNENGLRQAELLAEYFKDEKIDAIYSSPLERARKTAEIIAGRHELEVKNTGGLIDIDFGEWQGLSRQEVKDRYGELYATWINHPDRVKFPGGESLGEVRQRAREFVDKLVAEYEGKTVALVSHRVVNKVLICALLGLDDAHFWSIRQDTCGITTFNHENERFIMTRHNDTSFLAAMGQASLGDF